MTDKQNTEQQSQYFHDSKLAFSNNDGFSNLKNYPSTLNI
jgi:hypothetical protein